MATTTEKLRYFLELDNRDAIKGFSEVGEAGKDAAGQTEKSFDGLEGKGSGFGAGLGSKLAAGFASVGAGAIMVKSIETAFARSDARNIVQGQFGLTAQDAKHYGDMAGKLYADGWGAGYDEVVHTLANVSAKLDLTNDALVQSVSESALAISKTWDVDVNDVIRSTSQLMENGLVPDAQAAMDLIVAAFQNGGDEAGDLLDTIDEYSQHWSALGLSGEDALNQVIAGFQGGQRDADKMADAVKEMRLRIQENTEPVRKALEDIGVNADEVVEAFLEGGPAARAAFLEVIQALKDGQDQGDDTANAVAIIGTQFEDLGPKALDALLSVDGALDSTIGKAETLKTTVEATDWEKFRRNGENALQILGDQAIKAANDFFQPGVSGSLDKRAREAAEAAEKEAAAAREVGEAWERWANQGTKREGQLAAEAARHERINELLADQKLRFYGDALGAEALSDELAALRGNEVKLVDSTEDVSEAMEDADRKVGLLYSTVNNLIASLEREDALDGLAEKLIAASDGARLSERDIANLRLEVLTYGDQVAGLPDNILTEIDAMIDEGAYLEAERRLRVLAAARLAPITPFVTAPTGRTSVFSGIKTGAGAEGAVVNSPTLALIGEAGPEALVPLDKLPGNAPIESVLGGGGGGGSRPVTVNLYVQGVVHSQTDLGRYLNESLTEFVRSGGRTTFT